MSKAILSVYKEVEIDGVKLLQEEKGGIYIELSCTKRYHNCLYLLAGLNNCAICFMDYITERMVDNKVTVNGVFKNEFLEFIKSVTGGRDSYSMSAVDKGLRGLVDRGLLIKDANTIYRINEMYFFKGDEKDRIAAIILTLKIEYGKGTVIRVDRIEKNKRKKK